jgi:hypothetical protein
MSDKHDPGEKPSSKTGVIPRLDLNNIRRREPPRPDTLPEFEDDSGSVTGIINLRAQAEGEDSAKDDDDTPTKSALTS